MVGVPCYLRYVVSSSTVAYGSVFRIWGGFRHVCSSYVLMVRVIYSSMVIVFRTPGFRVHGFGV